MRRYLLKRLLGLVPLWLGITILSFMVIHLAPGSPVDAVTDLNPQASTLAKEKLRALYHLDEPIALQYGLWLKRLVFLDLGDSFIDGQAVAAKIGAAAKVTLLLSGLSMLLVFGFGVPLGVYCAIRRGRFADRFWSGISLLGFSMPTFWLALVTISFFGVTLRVLPVSGLRSLFYEEMGPIAQGIDLVKHLLLPVTVASLAGIAAVSRYTRSGMIEALGQNYVRTARAKGLEENKVIYGHALRNALLPVITLVGLSVPGLLGGSVILETIFSIPGMGRLFFQAVFARDYPVLMGILVIGSWLTLLGNLVADMAYAMADPRIRSEMRS